MLGCYPGYLSLDSILQLYTVRSGEFSDYAPVMTAVWSLLEYALAGPFPMLVLQSGLFLFGAFAILRTVVSPRVAAVSAGCLLLFPPVFSLLAVIWPEALMTGALIGALGAVLQDNPRWKLAALGLGVLACACRPEAVVAVFPLALAVLREERNARRAVLALAITLGIAGVARVADRLATVKDTHGWENQLQMVDVVGTLRRAKIKDETALERATAGMPVADPASLRERMTAGSDAINWRSVQYGDKRVFDPIKSDDEAAATSAAWRHAITTHPGAYLTHRWTLTRSLLALSKRPDPVLDNFGNPDLLAPLHHRAIPSDWELGMQRFVRGVARTPLFSPWLYLVLGIVAIAIARRRPLLRNLAIAGLALELAMMLFAPAPDYRYSHFLISAVSLVLVALAVGARKAWSADPNG